MRKSLIGALVALTSTAAFAQSTGTVTINGEVLETVSITFDAVSDVNSNLTTAANPNPQEGALAATLDFGNVASLTTWGVADVSFRLRSNAAYALTAELTTNNFGAVAGTVQPDNFGLQISHDGAGVRGTNNVAAGTDTVETTAADFTVDPTLADTSSGSAVFTGATLADIATAVDVMTGDQISSGGGLTSTDNFLTVTSRFAIFPEMFTPSTFDAQVTFTVAAAP